jgi:hypothetical protein
MKGRVWKVLLVAPRLHQAVVVDGVEADPLHRSLSVDLALDMPEVGFQLAPDRRITEAFQDQSEAAMRSP